MHRYLILLFSMALIVAAAQAETAYKLDKAFCERYSLQLAPYAPEIYYPSCMKLEEWAKTHPIEREECLAKDPGHPTIPAFGYARCLDSVRSTEQRAEREKCEKEATERENPLSPAWFLLMRHCDSLTAD